MAKFITKPNMTFEIVLKIDEKEAGALNALTDFGTDQFLNVFYKYLGEYNLKGYEDGLRSLFDEIQQSLPSQLEKIDKVKKTFNQ